jgi:toxin ParE1/3/4
MDKKVKWMPQTSEDLESIAEYIGRDSLYYASVFVEKLLNAGDSLSKYYKRGRIVSEKRRENIREIFVSEYRLIYEITDYEIRILTVVHGRRDLKKVLKKLK